MPPEYIIGYVMLAAIVVLGAGFIFTAMAARKGPDDYEPIHRSGYRVRRYWFVTLMCLGLIAFGFTLPHMATPMFRKPDPNTAMVVNVVGQQWAWTITPDTIPVGRTIEFRVTSMDVNHGFGIFNSNGNIVGQVQAMPGFTNDLYLNFSTPGTYPIRCLELCGVDHPLMISALTVTRAGASSAPAGASSVAVKVSTLPSVGQVLVNASGDALYMFTPDQHNKVTCTGACAATWPPLKLSGAKPAGGPGVKASLLGSDSNPAGGRVVTYNGWPLYTFAGDSGPGQTSGQGLDMNGGKWYLMGASGKPLS